MKVDFLIVGAQKAGTSALDVYLRRHPEIEMAQEKELHYFDVDENFLNPPDYARYHAHFDHAPNKRVRGEATPSYMYWLTAPSRIWEYNPEMKLIAVLRNPVERAYSHWNMERDRKNDQLPFLDAIQSESERCRAALPQQHLFFSYADRGFYTEQLRRLWHFFPKQQTLILKHEDLKFKLAESLSQIARFLGVAEFQQAAFEDIHSRPYKSPMTEAARLYLEKVFRYEIKELESLLDWDCSDWLKRKTPPAPAAKKRR